MEYNLDRYLEKLNIVLRSAITADVSTSALSDLVFGYIMLFVFGFTISKFILLNK